MVQIYNYIIYHKGCIDGFSGFFVAYISNKLDKNVYIHADMPSAVNIPPNIDNKNIIIIDVAYKKEILEEIFKYANSVVFIDHHVSIKDDVAFLHKKYNKKNITIIYDDMRCGATLTWKFLFPRQKIPYFLKFVEDHDTGKWKYSKTKPFILGLETYYHLSTEEKSLNKWFRLLNKKNVRSLIKKGNHIKKYQDHLIAINLPRHSLMKFPSKIIYNIDPKIFKKIGQYRVAVFNGMSCPSVTELANVALDKIYCDFTIMWIFNIDKKEYIMSLRSKYVDVSKISQIFGGGGHKLAAACNFSSAKYHISDLFEQEPLPRSFVPLRN